MSNEGIICLKCDVEWILNLIIEGTSYSLVFREPVERCVHWWLDTDAGVQVVVSGRGWTVDVPPPVARLHFLVVQSTVRAQEAVLSAVGLTHVEHLFIIFNKVNQ